MLRDRVRRAIREEPRLVALLFATGVIVYVGIWRVHPHQMIPDEVGATAQPFTLLEGPGLTDFKKGGNLHIWLLTLAYVPVLVVLSGYWLVTGQFDRNLENAREVAQYQDGTQWDVANGAVVTAYDLLITTGRFVTATAGVLTVLALVLLGRRLSGRPAGLFAGATLSVTLGFVLTAKFATEDVIAACLLAWTLVAMAKYVDTGDDRSLLIAAGLAGLAISAKVTTGILAVPIAFLAFCQLGRDDRWTWSTLRGLARYPAAALGAYVATTPSILLHPDRYVAELTRYVSVRAGQTTYYTHPDPGYLAHLGHLVTVFGVPLFALVVVSVVAVIALTATGRIRRFTWIPIGLTVLYLGIISSWGNVQYNRVFIVVPLLALFVGLAAAWATSVERPRLRTVAGPMIALVLVLSLFYTASGVAAWSTSRADATEWTHEHFDEETSVTTLSHRTYLPEFPDGTTVSRAVIDPMADLYDENRAQQTLAQVGCHQPEHIVLTSFHYGRFVQDPSFAPETTDLYRTLLAEEDYRIVETFGPDDPNLRKNAAGRFERALRLQPPAVNTNNPRIVILERTSDPIEDCPELEG